MRSSVRVVALALILGCVAGGIIVAFWPVGPALRVLEMHPVEDFYHVIQLQPRRVGLTAQHLIKVPARRDARESLSPDGRYVAVTAADGIDIWSVDKGTVVRRIAPAEPSSKDRDSGPVSLSRAVWNADGTMFCYVVKDPPGDPDIQSELRLFSVKGDLSPERWGEFRSHEGYPMALSPSGQQVVLKMYGRGWEKSREVLALRDQPVFEFPPGRRVSWRPVWGEHEDRVAVCSLEPWSPDGQDFFPDYYVWELSAKDGSARLLYEQNAVPIAYTEGDKSLAVARLNREGWQIRALERVNSETGSVMETHPVSAGVKARGRHRIHRMAESRQEGIVCLWGSTGEPTTREYFMFVSPPNLSGITVYRSGLHDVYDVAILQKPGHKW